jgi:hypothetical protein
MDYKTACKILNLESEFKIKKLRKQYYKMAMLYHPDKNIKKGSEERFQKINEAYIYLQTHLKVEIEETSLSYFSVIKKCVNHLFPAVPWNEVFLDSTLTGILTNCKKASLKIFNEINKDKAFEVYSFLSANREIFSVSEETLSEMYIILQKKLTRDHLVILNPTIEDLMDDKIYKLKILDMDFMVPLWNHEVCFDISGADLIVKSLPELEDHITIDNNNNIVCRFEGKIKNVLENKEIKIKIGNKIFTILGESLTIKSEQTHVLRNKGLLKVDENDLYSIKTRGHIYIDIKLS